MYNSLPYRRSNLYFVESVAHINASEENYPEQRIAILQYIPIDIQKWIDKSQDFKWYRKIPLNLSDAELVREGEYVYYLDDEGFLNASDDERVSKIKHRSDELYKETESLINNDPMIHEIHDVSMLYSYHINVGHGNLSLLVFECDNKKHIWMIDGSDYDFLQHRNYTSVIQKAFDYIKNKFDIDNPHVEVLMITHAHYDHYSGITRFIKYGLIDSQTEVFLNFLKKVASHNFNNLVSELQKNKIKHIIQPFTHKSSPNINIIYPELSTFSGSLKINNTSSVYCIRFDGVNYITFPGDLETEGWDLIDNHRCCPYFNCTKYYVVSHHGSLNGHLRSKCTCRCNITNVCDCLLQNTKTVLMGRDHAFNGIYSNRVLQDFDGRLFCSEKDDKGVKAAFLEIDLLSGVESWHY